MVDMTASDTVLTPAERDVRKYLRFGWGIIIAVFGSLIAWSVFAPFEGAVLTQGQVAVESNQQAIQHLEGGIVREIHVREGDVVKAGQLLISLDQTTTDAGVQALEARLFELLGREARLLAERDGVRTLSLRKGFTHLASEPQMQSILTAQSGLRETRASTRFTQTTILRQRIEQLQNRINGMRQEITAKDAQLGLLDDEIEGEQTLLDKGLGNRPRILNLQRDRSRTEGDRMALVSEIASTEIQIGEANSEIAKLTQGNREEVLTELRDVQTEIGAMTEERTAALDRQRRLDIVAPRAGKVIGVRAHTLGGVINPSDAIMYIVPANDRLVAKVRVSPIDIDKITIGQKATLRFTAFNQDETPQFNGEVTRVSADALTDQATGQVYFEAVVAIPDEALEASDFVLLPGMPVDAQLRTGSRSVLSYLVKPLTDSVARTFRE